MPRKDNLKGYQAKWQESKSSVYFYPLTMKDPFDNDFQTWVYWPELSPELKPDSIASTLRHMASGLSLACYPHTPEYLFTFSVEYQCIFTWHQAAYEKWQSVYAHVVEDDQRARAKERFDLYTVQPLEFYRLHGFVSQDAVGGLIAPPKWRFEQRIKRYVLRPQSESDLKLIPVKTSQLSPDPVHSVQEAGKKVFAYTPEQFKAYQQRLMRIALHTQKNLEDVVFPFYVPERYAGYNYALCVLNMPVRFHVNKAIPLIKQQLDKVMSDVSQVVQIDLNVKGWLILALPLQYFNAYKSAYKEKTGLSLVDGEGIHDPYQIEIQRQFFTAFPGYSPPILSSSFAQLTSMVDLVHAVAFQSDALRPGIDNDLIVVGTLSILDESRQSSANQLISRAEFGESMAGIGSDSEWFYAFVYWLKIMYVQFQKAYGDCDIYTFISAVNLVRRQIFDTDRYANLFNDEGRIMLTRKEACIEICDLNDASTLTPSHANAFYFQRLAVAKQSNRSLMADVMLLQVQIASLSTLLLQMMPRMAHQQVQAQSQSRLQRYLNNGQEINQLLFIHKPTLFMQLLNRQSQLFVAKSQIQGADQGLYAHNSTEQVLTFKKGDVLAWYQGEIIDTATFRSSPAFDETKTYCTALGENSIGHASRLIRHNPDVCLGQSAYYANHNSEGLCELRTVYGKGGLEIGKVLKVRGAFSLEPGQVMELTFNYGRRAAMETHGIPEDSLTHPVETVWFHRLALAEAHVLVMPVGQSDKAAWLLSSQEKSRHYEAESLKRIEIDKEKRRVSAAKRRASKKQNSHDEERSKKPKKGATLFAEPTSDKDVVGALRSFSH